MARASQCSRNIGTDKRRSIVTNRRENTRLHRDTTKRAEDAAVVTDDDMLSLLGVINHDMLLRRKASKSTYQSINHSKNVLVVAKATSDSI